MRHSPEATGDFLRAESSKVAEGCLSPSSGFPAAQRKPQGTAESCSGPSRPRLRPAPEGLVLSGPAHSRLPVPISLWLLRAAPFHPPSACERQ